MEDLVGLENNKYYCEKQNEYFIKRILHIALYIIISYSSITITDELL